MDAPITDLAGVSAWLAGVNVGDTVTVAASQFSASMVTDLFALLPDGGSITIEVTAVDAAAATLAGTGDILEEDGTTAAFTWSQNAGGPLALQLALALPSTSSWPLMSQLDVALNGVSASFAPNLEAETFGLTIAGSLAAGTLPAIPVTLAAPSVTGNWTLTAGEVSVTDLDAASLTALGGGQNPLSALPSTFSLGDLSITGVDMVFDPIADTVTAIGIGFDYQVSWPLFAGFEVTGIDLALRVRQPFTAPALQATLAGTIALPNTDFTFEVGAIVPDEIVFVMLAPGSQLDLTQVITALGGSLPSGFPAIDLDALAFTIFVKSQLISFQIGIDTPFAIIGDVQLLTFHFNLQADFSSTPSAQGALSTSVSFGSTVMTLRGAYTASGLTMAGSLQNVDVTTLIADLETSFGYTAPAALAQITIDLLSVGLSTGSTKAFAFTLDGSAAIAAATVSFTVDVNLAYDTTWTGDAKGTLAIATSGGDQLAFAVEFSDTATDEFITATYTGSPFGLDDLIGALGLGDLPVIPPDLDLAITAASFTYHFTSLDFTFTATSANYGQLTLTSTVSAGVRSYTARLATGQTFSLSNLPLVGAELAKVETVTVDDLAVVITSAPSLAISAMIEFGDDKLPLALTIGGTPTTTLLADPAGGGVTSSTSSDGTTWYTVQRAFGPVTIARIGAQYQSATQTVWLELDATLAMGPLNLGLAGLGIGSPLSSFAPQFTLAGLTVGYQSPPLTIAGTLVNLEPPGSATVAFEGGLTIGTGEFTVNAFGYYGDSAGFSSMFVYGDLVYPFGGPPAFFVTGVALGVGYNSSLRLPTLDQVGTFPLITALPGAVSPGGPLGPSTTPLVALQALVQGSPPWVSPEAGELWLTAGITFTSFELVQSQAMVTVELGDALVIDLLGVSHAQFPQALDAGSVLYAFVELELEATFAPAQGVFSVQAVLAPSSFLLAKACVLTGGFAFFVWYGPSPHAGDFVLTLGGYNSGFTPPSYYPAVPPVGFHWSIDSTITVTGDAYLAITPAVFMAGGRLDATYQSGGTRAWFDAYVDVVLRWKPFWIEADLGIVVGVSHRMDLVVTTATITLELGCQLAVWGPPTGGTVEVEWGILKFTIHFGAPESSAPPINGWTDVVAMLPSAAPPDAPAQPVSVAPTAGLVAPSTAPSTSSALDDSGDPAPWVVRGSQFGFATSTAIPATAATVGTSHSLAGSEFAVYPLGWTGVSASHTIAFTQGTSDWSYAFTVAPITQAVPAALWGAPPQSPSGKSQVPSGGAQTVPDQLIGVAVDVLPPVVGGSPGAIDVATALAVDATSGPGVLPLLAGAPPAGDIPQASASAVATIADPSTGIAAAGTVAIRTALHTALAQLAFAPAASSSDLSRFAADLGCVFSDQPLVVP